MPTIGGEPDDSGLSLIELIVAVVVSSFILAGIAMIFINSWNTQEDVTTTTEATSSGQLVSSTIERAVRNADYLVVQNGNVLLVRTTLGGSLTCQGFDLSSGQARMSLSAGPISSHWDAWEDGVRADGSIPIFDNPSGSRRVSYTFELDTASAPVRFEGEATARVPLNSAVGGSPCW